MALCSTAPTPCQWFPIWADLLDSRSGPRLHPSFSRSGSRRRPTHCHLLLRAAGISHDFRARLHHRRQANRTSCRTTRHGDAQADAGRHRTVLSASTTRPPNAMGPHVEGAGLHHNRRRGPGRLALRLTATSGIVLGWLARHPPGASSLCRCWLALRSARPTCPALGLRPSGLSPHQVGTGRRTGAMGVTWLKSHGQTLWVVVDGATPGAFPQATGRSGRHRRQSLRRTAALWTVPGPSPGHEAAHGSTATNASTWPSGPDQTRGWQRGVFDLYGKPTAKEVQDLPSDLAAGRRLASASCWSRKHAAGSPSFGTDAAASVADVLAAVADRFSLETAFRDVKEVVGAGQQQVRFIGATSERSLLLPVDLYHDRGVVALEPSRRRPRGAFGLAVGRCESSALARRQTAGVARQLAGEEIRTLVRAG